MHLRRAGRHYYQGTDALVFVVDSSDRDRLAEASDELHKILTEDSMAHPVVLVFANKIDLPNALSSSAVADRLGLHRLKQTWFIQPSSAATGDGLAHGLDWLSAQIKLRPTVHRGAGS